MSGQLTGVGGVTTLPASSGIRAPIGADPAVQPGGSTPLPPIVAQGSSPGASSDTTSFVAAPATVGASHADVVLAAGANRAAAAANMGPGAIGLSPGVEVGTTGLAAGVPRPVIDAIVTKAIADVLGVDIATASTGIATDPASAALAGQALVDPAARATAFSGTTPSGQSQAVAGAALSTPSGSSTAASVPGAVGREPQLSAAGQQFVSALLNVDPAALTPQVTTALQQAWSGVSPQEKQALRELVTSQILTPAAQKLQQAASDPTLAQNPQGAASLQQMNASLQVIAALIQG